MNDKRFLMSCDTTRTSNKLIVGDIADVPIWEIEEELPLPKMTISLPKYLETESKCEGEEAIQVDALESTNQSVVLFETLQ